MMMTPLDGLTLWPDMEVPSWPVARVSWALVDHRRLLFPSSIAAVTYPLPQEFWMRELLRLDNTSPHAILEFCNLWGGLDDTRIAPTGVPVSGFAWEVGKLQAAASTLLAISGGADTDRPARIEARDEINKRMVRYPPPRVGFAGEDDWQTMTPVALEIAICVQMHNFIFTSPHVSTCQRCGQPYVHQRGRTRYGGHRTSLYCTSECAVAQSKQAYRERQRKSRAKGGETT